MRRALLLVGALAWSACTGGSTGTSTSTSSNGGTPSTTASSSTSGTSTSTGSTGTISTSSAGSTGSTGSTGSHGSTGASSSSGGSTGSGLLRNCNSDVDCSLTEACNTQGHVCLTVCTTSADCPDAQKTCAAVPGGTEKVCQCTTDQLCGGGSSFCHPVDKVCEVKCSDNSGCTGFNPARTCNTSSGICSASTAGNCLTNANLCTSAQYCDAGTAACVNKCTSDTQCGPGGVCDFSTGICGQASNGCPGADYTQSTCSYGNVCVTQQCYAPDVCTAVANPPAIVSGASPVIFSPTRTGTRPTDSSEAGTCSTDLIVQFAVDYYDPQADAAGGSAYMRVLLVKPDGTIPSAASGNTYHRVAVTTTGFTFEVCSASTSLFAGVVLKDASGNISNVVCLP